MDTSQTAVLSPEATQDASAWRKTDTMWMLGLYGLAIGAGVLFLPINAGIGGLIPLIIMAVLAFPMTFLLTVGCAGSFSPGANLAKILPRWSKNTLASEPVN